MKTKKKVQESIKKDVYTKEYEQIIGVSKHTTITNIEWKESGDFFKKFSMYDDYTPVKTSSNTTCL